MVTALRGLLVASQAGGRDGDLHPVPVSMRLIVLSCDAALLPRSGVQLNARATSPPPHAIEINAYDHHCPRRTAPLRRTVLYAMRLNPTVCHPELREGSINPTTDSSLARNDRITTIQPQFVLLLEGLPALSLLSRCSINAQRGGVWPSAASSPFGPSASTRSTRAA